MLNNSWEHQVIKTIPEEISGGVVFNFSLPEIGDHQNSIGNLNHYLHDL